MTTPNEQEKSMKDFQVRNHFIGGVPSRSDATIHKLIRSILATDNKPLRVIRGGSRTGKSVKKRQ